MRRAEVERGPKTSENWNRASRSAGWTGRISARHFVFFLGIQAGAGRVIFINICEIYPVNFEKRSV